MSSKRKPESQLPAEENDLLLIRPLGAGQEVGRSCIMLEFKGKKIMLDCGENNILKSLVFAFIHCVSLQEFTLD
jgi:cleavage and polyadenylation specificity factor subunit 3